MKLVLIENMIYVTVFTVFTGLIKGKRILWAGLP